MNAATTTVVFSAAEMPSHIRDADVPAQVSEFEGAAYAGLLDAQLGGNRAAMVCLLDRSGSVGCGSDAQTGFAMRLCAAEELIERFSVAVVGFSLDRESDTWEARMFNYKPFDADDADRCLGALRFTGHGGTPTKEALAYAGELLAGRSEPAKVALLVTDGAPTDPAATQDAADALMAQGVRLLVINATTYDDVTFLAGAESITVPAFNETPGALLALLSGDLRELDRMRAHQQDEGKRAEQRRQTERTLRAACAITLHGNFAPLAPAPHSHRDVSDEDFERFLDGVADLLADRVADKLAARGR